MVINIEGIYRNGQVELMEKPTEIYEGMRAVVTFGSYHEIEGVNKLELETVRRNLETFATDWDSPEMSVYDNYDAAKTRC
jgi:hypothetical protein